MSSADPKSDDLPVTMALVALAQVLRFAALLYQSESILARCNSMPAPVGYWSRCEELFYKTYAAEAQACGLNLNDTTFRLLLSDQMPDALLRCNHSDLMANWVFNQHFGWRKREEHEGASLEAA